MLKWLFGRADPAPAPRKKAQAVAPSKRRSRPAPLDPLPLPKVVSEGNTEADWSEWESSMMQLDSQMQGLAPDAFGKVSKNRDV